MNRFDESNVNRDQGKFATKAQSAAEATLKPVTAFQHPYTPAPFEPGETARGSFTEAVALVCFCGNSEDNSGFEPAGEDGRYLESKSDAAVSVCRFCGRIYANEIPSDGSAAPVIGRVDRSAPDDEDYAEARFAEKFGD